MKCQNCNFDMVFLGKGLIEVDEKKNHEPILLPPANVYECSKCGFRDAPEVRGQFPK